MSRIESEQTYELESGKVMISTSSGDIKVIGGEHSQVIVQCEEGPADVSQEGDQLIIKAGKGGSRDLFVQVPHVCDVAASTASGDIRIGDVTGTVEIKTMSGDFIAEGIRGKVAAHTVSGDVRLRESCIDHLTLQTVSGDADIESPLNQEGSYDLHSVSGDVRLHLPADQALSVKRRSLSGGFKCELPHEMTTASMGHPRRAEINGGGVLVKVTSTSGGLTIKSAESAKAESGPEPRPFVDEDMVNPFAVDEADAEAAAAWEEEADEEADEEASEEAEPFGLDEEALRENESREAKRMEILRAIEEGRLTVDEGLAQLADLE